MTLRSYYNERPTQIKFTQELSNGQYASLWFRRSKNSAPQQGILYIWSVALYIGSLRDARGWFSGRSRRSSAVTGECGLEGLLWAAKIIRIFAGHLNHRHEIQIGSLEERRKRAYKILARRYDGFISVIDDRGREYIAYRDPGYWDWKPTMEAKGNERDGFCNSVAGDEARQEDQAGSMVPRN